MATSTIKQKLDSAMKATKDKLGPAVQATKDMLEKVPTPEIQLVNIVGELVSFVPTGLAPSETTIVEFDTYYKPDGISEIDYDILKKIMRRLFDGKQKAVADPDTGEDSDILVKEPLPPCSEKEKFMVLDSLLHRKRIIFQQLYNQGILTPEEMKKKISTLKGVQTNTSLEGKDSLLVRSLLTHLFRLEKFIESYVQNQQCINIEDLIYEKLELDLNDDKIKELLKQFIFFLLQSSHPLQEYTKIKPTPPTFIKRLETNLLKEKFPTFLQSYKDNKFPIPDTIAKILEAINVDPNILKGQINQAVELERKRILKHLQNTIPSTNSFWKQVGDTDDLIRILDVLKDNEGAMKDEIAQLTREKEDLDRQLKVCQQSKTALQAEKVRFEQRVQALEATIRTHTDVSNQLAVLQQEKAAADADFARREGDLQQQIRECTTQKAQVDQEVQRLRVQNQALTDELVPLRQQATQLATIQQQAQDNIAELQRQHNEALEEERQRTAEKETARLAAEAMVKETKEKLTANQLKLVQAESALRNEQAKMKAKDTSIVELQRQLTEKDNEIASIRTEISKKNEEKREFDKQIGESVTHIRELEEELTTLREKIAEAQGELGPFNQKLAEANERISTLEKELNTEKTKVNDLTIQRDACNSELDTLKRTASDSQRNMGQLTGELETAKGERDAAIAQQKILEAELLSLKTQLQDAKEENTLKGKQINGKDEKIKELESTLASQQTAMGTLSEQVSDEKERADKAESKVQEIEQEKDTLTVLAQQQIAKVSEELKSNYETAMGKAQEVYDAALEKQEAEKQKILEFVRNIKDWLDTDKTSSLSLPTDIPEQDSFSSIITSLSKSSESTSSAPSSPKALKDQQSNAICYLVFLASFLWQTHFPTFLVPPTDEIKKERYQRQVKILDLFTSFFNGGKDPSAKTASTSSISGLYKDIDPARETNVIFRLLDIFYNLMRSIEDDPKKYLPYLSFQDKDTLDKLMKKITLMTSANKVSDSFVKVVSDFFVTRQPQINNNFLYKFVVYDASTKTITIVDKAPDSKIHDPSNLNYAVLFYCYLVCIRDYLNHIKGSTVKCQLPTYLLKK
jgi:DNA repair exonuclease SbcCD ATPase subunit